MKHHQDIVIIGHGSIAQYVVEQILLEPKMRILALISRKTSSQRAKQYADGRFMIRHAIKEVSPTPDLVVDCAGHGGLIAHGCDVLERGINVVSISTGAMTAPGLAEKLERSAKAGGASVKFLSGAVGGIDALLAAKVGGLTEVRYVGRKPPLGWLGSRAQEACDLRNLVKPFEHFSGTARDAARLYPANANVAATLALASTGLDHVSVKLIADPAISKNIHEIEAKGTFGELAFKIAGNPLPNNPKSSALAAMSIVRELKQYVSPMRF